MNFIVIVHAAVHCEVHWFLVCITIPTIVFSQASTSCIAIGLFKVLVIVLVWLHALSMTYIKCDEHAILVGLRKCVETTFIECIEYSKKMLARKMTLKPGFTRAPRNLKVDIIKKLGIRRALNLKLAFSEVKTFHVTFTEGAGGEPTLHAVFKEMAWSVVQILRDVTSVFPVHTALFDVSFDIVLVWIWNETLDKHNNNCVNWFVDRSGEIAVLEMLILSFDTIVCINDIYSLVVPIDMCPMLYTRHPDFLYIILCFHVIAIDLRITQGHERFFKLLFASRISYSLEHCKKGFLLSSC